MTKSNSSNLKPRWPRPYLSWSQMDLWEKSPSEYIKRYIYGNNPTNPAMMLGKEVAEMLEHDQEHKDIEKEQCRILIPKFPEREFELKTTYSDVPLLGKLDGFDPESLVIAEFKTGRAWSQMRADQHGQLAFYALLVHKNYMVNPEKIKISLFWMPTERDEYGNPVLTGEVIEFKTSRTMRDILFIASRAKKAWKEIGEKCAEEYQSLGI